MRKVAKGGKPEGDGDKEAAACGSAPAANRARLVSKDQVRGVRGFNRARLVSEDQVRGVSGFSLLLP